MEKGGNDALVLKREGGGGGGGGVSINQYMNINRYIIILLLDIFPYSALFYSIFKVFCYSNVIIINR